jgi:enamine deaminase RidA (YjgF/YER057c/UK114 family)
MASPAPASTPSRGYVTPVVVHGGVAFVSGQLPREGGELKFRGKVGGAVDLESARSAAVLCADACIAALERELGGRGRILQLLKVTGFVASAAGFNSQPQVIDAASARLLEVLGPRGAHARSAVGVAELPHDAPVEIELIAAVKDPD